MGSATWLAIAVWVAVAVGLAALVYAWQLTRRNRQLDIEQVRPQVAVFMEPHPADWHLVELVVRNFGRTAAYDVRFTFFKPPTVARYEDGYDDRRPDVVELSLPSELPVLAPGQEWRTVWDSQPDRQQLGESIESRFDGTVTYYDRASGGGRFKKRRAYRSKVMLDWHSLQPFERLELLTKHDLARREKQKLELLRSLLTYYSYATKEHRPDVLRAEIERMNRAAEETHERLRGQQFDDTTEIVNMQWDNSNGEEAVSGRHHHHA
ncbi:MAG: hypothetical protein JO152_03960 [Mycobacteriaceae bacterium]|nr:hypothetical protein [Mycobacteriaceae bacterium]